MEISPLQGVTWERRGVMGTSDIWGDFSWKQMDKFPQGEQSATGIFSVLILNAISVFNHTSASVLLLGHQEVIFRRHFPQSSSHGHREAGAVPWLWR